MLSPLDQFFLNKQEPEKSCLEFLRSFILSLHPEITEHWKYGLPFYYLKGKMFCYLWIHKKLCQPYIGIVEGGRINHPDLLKEKRARMKILLVDAEKDIDKKTIRSILQEAMRFYK